MDFLLRSWNEADAAALCRYANNEKIAKSLRDIFPHPYTLANAQKYIHFCLAQEGICQVARAIEIREEVVGNISISFGNDVHRKSAELGYWLGEPFWGHGIMSEAVMKMCRFVFGKYDIERIYAEPFAENFASRRVLEKAGFVLEGVLKNSVYKNGILQDSCIYALLKE